MAGTIIEDLSDEEKYLYAILTDESGLDLAEFTFIDEEQRDGCWRAWAYQWKWFRSKDPLQIDQCGRSVGKSMSIKIRGFAFPFVHPGAEMVVTAPELVHLEPVVGLIENQFYNTKLGRSMMIGGRSAVTHRPFMMTFRNGARIIGRIPQKDGKGVKGIHPLWLELDEAQDYPAAGWIELFETLKRGSVGAVWRAHGVTRGVRDHFYRYTADPDSRWKVHRFTGMHRPTWTDEERTDAIYKYGGRDDPDYRRNVLGQHGDATSPIFVLHRLMACTDDNQESDYNREEYCNLRITEAWLRQTDSTILDELSVLPQEHLDKYRTFWVGMDVGLTNHPSEIVVFAEHKMDAAEYKHQKAMKVGQTGGFKSVPATQETTRLKLITRISLQRIGSPDQHEAILRVIDHYKPKAFAFDKGGLGLPIFQDIQEVIENNPDFTSVGTTIKGYNFSGNILVDFDRTIPVDEFADRDEVVKDTGIKRNSVEYATDRMRKLVDEGRIWLPWDADLLGELQGQTYKITKTALNQYGKREYSLGKFHAFDACRMAILGWAQYGIEEFMKLDESEPVLELFGY